MAASSNQYPFSNDFHALARLNYQHSLFKQRTGFLLHPDISFGNMHDLRVADIGAGTWFVASAVSMAVDQSPKFHRLIVGLLSIWLTELSDLLPSSAQLDAFDISASQYPPQEWLPHNISLHIHNAFSPFPQDALAKYDVVHVQCFITLIANDDPAPLIEILMSLLSRFLKHQSPLTAVCLLIRPCCATEPGGFLQWNEIDAASGKIITPPNKSVSTSATNRFIKFMKNPQVGHSISWVSQLDRTLAKLRFSDVKLTRYEIAPKHYFCWNLNRLLAADELVKNGKTACPNDRNVDCMVAETFEEFQQGVVVTADLIVAIGKKPGL